jgi:hypothetical protein
MDLLKMISDLKEEKKLLDDAIVQFERLVANRGKRRGRPPKWLKQAEKKRKHAKGTTDPSARNPPVETEVPSQDA